MDGFTEYVAARQAIPHLTAVEVRARFDLRCVSACSRWCLWLPGTGRLNPSSRDFLLQLLRMRWLQQVLLGKKHTKFPLSRKFVITPLLLSLFLNQHYSMNKPSLISKALGRARKGKVGRLLSLLWEQLLMRRLGKQLWLKMSGRAALGPPPAKIHPPSF